MGVADGGEEVCEAGVKGCGDFDCRGCLDVRFLQFISVSEVSQC